LKKSILLFLALVVYTNILLPQNLTEVWKSEKIYSTPESVFYDAERSQIYVSNINGQPTEKDGNGFISLVGEDGIIEKLKWIEGFNAPKGMAVHKNILYVTDIDRIAIINIEKEEIVKFIEVAGAQFLNDMVADESGNVYITDMTKNQLLILKNEKINSWLEIDELKNPNGLAMENGNLLVGCNNYLLSFNPKTKEYNYLVKDTGGIDGLIPLGNGKYIISDWAGKIQLISINDHAIVLQNISEENIQAADLGYIPNRKLLLIPTFFDNRVIMMELYD
jgi:DNA-binding beta-propeller fold protein YncE